MIVGGIFKISVTFPNVSMTFPIASILIMGLYSHLYGICFKVYIAVSGKEFCQLAVAEEGSQFRGLISQKEKISMIKNWILWSTLKITGGGGLAS